MRWRPAIPAMLQNVAPLGVPRRTGGGLIHIAYNTTWAACPNTALQIPRNGAPERRLGIQCIFLKVGPPSLLCWQMRPPMSTPNRKGSCLAPDA